MKKAWTVILAAATLSAMLVCNDELPVHELPPEIRMDRYMVQVVRQIENEQYTAALRTIDRLLDLQETHGLKLPESFWITRAEIALKVVDYVAAMMAASRYLETAGRGGERYAEALELLDRAIEQGCAPDRMTRTIESLRACLALDADLDGVDQSGKTTLDWAAERDDPAILAALVEAGADAAGVVVAESETISAAMRPGTVFRDDCSACPEMVVVPEGSFQMGSPGSEEGRWYAEGPQHRVTIGLPFAVGVYEVTFAEWDACARAGGCAGYSPEDEGWGRGNRPVIHVSWEDAREYVRWLSSETGEKYRLLSEAEWEYVARAGTQTARYWGDSAGRQCSFGNGDADDAPCSETYESTAPVGSFQPNSFGLYDVLGNVWEWTQDCWNTSYLVTSGGAAIPAAFQEPELTAGRALSAPSDGTVWRSGDCSRRVLRGGSWDYEPWGLRSAYRNRSPVGSRVKNTGFRVARTTN